MPIHEHQPIHKNTFNRGADFDSEKEISCEISSTGIYIDARNGRPNSNDGNTGSFEKIKGEEILYPNTGGQSGYKRTWSASVNQDIVEVWANINPAFAGIIRVNGVVVLESTNFKISAAFPFQGDKNESCIGGEIMITDNNIPPFIFNIKDMVDSLISNPNKYFSAFDPLLYQINLQSPLDIPVFIELVNVGGGGGLPVGHYEYQMRYSSKEGDRTNWSQATPMIPVMQALSSESEYYPWVKTYGGPPAPSSKTAFAPKLRFRVTNIYNYDYIEIKRVEYNQGAGIDFSPNGKIVARIDIQNQEISVREYLDPAESNVDIAISANEETRELVEVEKAKTLRYFDKRLVLMNVTISSKEADLTYKTINDKEGFPVVDDIGKEGYNDPWNHVYKKSYMRGEKYGFGVNLYDGVGTKGFVDQITTFKNYQFPNRRDVVAPETIDYSIGTPVKAATTNAGTEVDRTHEVFDLESATYKKGECDFKNIIQSGKVVGLTGTKTKTAVTDDCDESNEEIENHGANVELLGLTVSVSYQPFTPVRQNDADDNGHNYVVNTKVADEKNIAIGNPLPENQYNYRPSGFGPRYHSMGLMLSGVSGFPKWAKAFSVVRTNPAKRVVCQGIGYYALTKGAFRFITSDSLGGKELNKIRFFSPDIENGIVSSDTVNDIIDNPQNYSLQFVSPLGFFSEWYSAEDRFSLTNPERDRCIDMISYVRMLRDHESDVNNQLNPSEDASMGVSGGDGYNYIAYDKFRNITQSPNTFNGDSNKGNKVIGISVVRRVSEGRGAYIEIEMPESIYGKASTGGNSNSDFEDEDMKNWTEPVYIVNIIRTGANVSDQNIQKYKRTSHYQKLESIIGRSTGVNNQKFILVDERFEDAIPALSSTSFGASTDRYLYIKKTDGSIEKWINVTFKTLAQVSQIKSDIITLGAYNSDVKGIYRHENIESRNRFFNIVFDDADYIPEVDSLIIIKYDDTAPIRVYGGDTYIGETIFAPIDSQGSAKDDAAETQFAFGIGLPFKQFKINPRYYTIRKSGAIVNVIQDKEWFTLGFIRQLCVMFTVESRIACHLAYNNASAPNQFFPLINYVIRPNRWDADKSIVDNGIYQDYVDDYTETEKSYWKWGGFRFSQQINPDYSCEPRIEFFSKPQFGFEEQTEFCTRVMWSLPRAINSQNAPGLKTFPANNSFDLDDDQGEIKRAWEATTERGENLYAFSNTGICLLLTKKSILSDLNSGDIGYMAADSFISAQYWLYKDIGMFDEMWRSAAEASIPLSMENGAEIRREAIFFANNESVFRFMDNQAVDIGRTNYYTKVFNKGLAFVKPGYETHVTAVFNKHYKEYWLHIQSPDEVKDVDNTFVFGQKENMWYGTNDFKFDGFTVRNNQIFGHRDLQTWDLEKGYLINGSPVVLELLTGASPDQSSDKEFIGIRINSPSNQKPTRVEFYKTLEGAVQCSMDASNPNQGALFLKDYRGFEGLIPRIFANVDPNRPRFQQRLLIYRIIHNLQSEFKVIDSSVQFKKIK